MTRSQVVLASLATLASFTFLPSSALLAQDLPDTAMSQHQFSGVLNADNVYVRSGPSENDYPVTKLSKGDNVVIVGMKYDWLKILPPENTFCLVGKAWVDKRGDGSIGRVREDAVSVANVRVGSLLNNMITKVAMQLKPGDDVKILGEQDEYFKIAPPAGTFMYVHRKFVDPIKSVEVVNVNGQLEVKQPEVAVPSLTPNSGAGATVTPAPTASDTTTASTTLVNPAQPDAVAVASLPLSGGTTTQPTAAVASAAEAEFDALEAKFTESSKLPLEQQPLDELLSGYQKVVDEKTLPESMLRVAEVRLKGLTLRKEALADYLATQRMREELAARQKPLQAEAAELTQRLAENQVKRYTAVGTLRTSALTYGGKTLYRLTDPATERTVVYILTSDPELTRLQGLFLAVKGDITDDTVRKIKFIEPKSFETIDPTQIARGQATSVMTPASLLPASASMSQ